MNRFLVAAILLLTSANRLAAADWPAFRGPTGDGFSAEDKAPVEWSASDNVAWKAELPQPGNGSPIVVADRVLVTCAEDEEGKQRSLYCFDRNSGKQLWVRTVHVDEKMPTHKTNPYCGSTPASDGKRVIVFHGSAGLYCYDLDGKELWSRNLGEFRHMWGYGASPLFHKGKVLLHAGPGANVYLTAIDPTNGKQIWKTAEPIEGDGNRRDDNNPMGSWSTPVVANVEGQEQIICMMPTRVNAYDAESGDIIWSCEGLVHDRGSLAYSSPIIVGDLCFVTGGYKGPTVAIRLGGSGNVTESHRLYRNENSPQSIGTGVAIDGYVYRPNAGGPAIQCIDPATGEVLWSERGAGANWGSVVSAGGLLYVTNKKGTTLVFKPNPKEYEEVARNELDDSSNTTPAISNEQIFIRSDGHLFCIGE
jgi:outer membrane protein assembly factor BamB